MDKVPIAVESQLVLYVLYVNFNAVTIEFTPFHIHLSDVFNNIAVFVFDDLIIMTDNNV